MCWELEMPIHVSVGRFVVLLAFRRKSPLFAKSHHFLPKVAAFYRKSPEVAAFRQKSPEVPLFRWKWLCFCWKSLFFAVLRSFFMCHCFSLILALFSSVSFFGAVKHFS